MEQIHFIVFDKAPKKIKQISVKQILVMTISIQDITKKQ